MSTLMLVALLGCGVAFVFVLLLWKLLVLTGGIAAVQWAIVTGFADQPVVQAAAFAVPALLAACALMSLSGKAGLSARGLTRHSLTSLNSRRRAHQTRWEAMA